MKTIGMNEFVSRHDRRTQLIDVREPAEYAAGHVPGAVSVPLGQLQQRLAEVPKSDTVFVICASGNRSSQATETLTGFGINAVSVTEGTSGWVARGQGVVTGFVPR